MEKDCKMKRKDQHSEVGYTGMEKHLRQINRKIKAIKQSRKKTANKKMRRKTCTIFFFFS